MYICLKLYCMQKPLHALSNKWTFLLLFILSFVLYGNTIFNDYGYDDVFVVKGNKYVQEGIAGIPAIFENPYAVVDSVQLDKRPITLITFAVEHQLFNDNPHISHFINIILYALTLLVLYVLLQQAFQLEKVNKWLPLLIVVLFAIHPLHTEVVSSLKNRDELLVMLFGLLYLLLSYKYAHASSRRVLYLSLAIFSLALMLLSKITGFVFVFIGIAMFVFYKWHSINKRNWFFVLWSVLLLFRGLYVTLEGVNREFLVFENPLIKETNLLVKIGTAFLILLHHIKMLIFPNPMLFYYGGNTFPLVTLGNPLALFSMLLHVTFFVYGCVKFFKREMIGLFIICYFISIMLYANFPIPYTSMYAERTQFISSLWFILIMVSLFNLLSSLKPIKGHFGLNNKFVLIVLSVVFIVYSFLTINRNFYWKNSLILMEKDMPYLENSIIANYIYANNLKYESKQAIDTSTSKLLAQKAVTHYRQAIKLVPGFPEFHYKLASTYRYNLKNLDSAEIYYGYALSLDSIYADANYEMAKLFFDKADFQRSNYYFEKTYPLKPTDSMTLFYYGQTALKMGNLSTAYKIDKEFLNLYPNHYYPYVNLGVYYSTALKDDSAVIYFDKAIEKGYREPSLLAKLAYYYETKGNQEKAKYYRSLSR